jgi:8-oxo-dGTP pyrophosphatase MutT (NUDIX family)
MKADKISIDQAKTDKLFYVVANVYPVREDGRVLILKRDMREKVFPGKWAPIGGKMEHADFDISKPSKVDGDVLVYVDPLLDLLNREAMEEAGITIAKPFNLIENKLIIRSDGIPVNLMTFTAKYAGGEIKLEQGGFTDFAWVNAEEVGNYDCIESVRYEVKAALELNSN